METLMFHLGSVVSSQNTQLALGPRAPRRRRRCKPWATVITASVGMAHTMGG